MRILAEVIAVLTALSLPNNVSSSSWTVRTPPTSMHLPAASSRVMFTRPTALNRHTVAALRLAGGSSSLSPTSESSIAPTVDSISSVDVEEGTKIGSSDGVARGGAAKTKKRLSKATKSAETATIMSQDVTFMSMNTTVDSSIDSIVDNEADRGEKVEDRGRRLKRLLPHKRHHQIAKKLKNRNARNLRRKFMHASFGLFFATLNHFIPKSKFVPGMAILSTATLIMELLRYREGFSWMNDALHFVLGQSLRKHEMDGKFTGSFYFFTGVTLTAALYPTTCATMGIVQLALADPSASYFGRQTRHIRWSRIGNELGGFGKNKGILGFLGGALFCVPFNYRALSIAHFGTDVVPCGRSALACTALALGAAGALADLAVPTPAVTLPKKVYGVRVPPFHLDDNFVVPIISGYACKKVFQVMGWPQDVELAKFIVTD